MSIFINAPSSHIGRRLATRLLDAGEKVTLTSRDKKKVEDLVKRGARVLEGSALEDPALVAKALEGADALFWLTPPPARPDYYAWSAKAALEAATAARKAGVKRAALLSSMGAQSGPGTGPTGVARELENNFEANIPNVVSLRPGFFMENLFFSVETITKSGQIYMALSGSRKLPWVATADIADKAACWLLDRDWRGHHRIGVHGPKDLTLDEVATLITAALGKPVKFVEVTLEQAHMGLKGATGMPDAVADIYMEAFIAWPEGRMDVAEPRTPETTTPTSLAEFLREVFLPAIKHVA